VFLCRHCAELLLLIFTMKISLQHADVIRFHLACRVDFSLIINFSDSSHNIFELFDVQNIVTLKFWLGVIDVHWKLHNSINPIRFLL